MVHRQIEEKRIATKSRPTLDGHEGPMKHGAAWDTMLHVRPLVPTFGLVFTCSPYHWHFLTRTCRAHVSGDDSRSSSDRDVRIHGDVYLSPNRCRA